MTQSISILVLGGSFTGQYLAREFPEHQVHFLARSAADLRARGFAASTPAELSAALAGAESPAFPKTIDAILDTVPAVLPPDAGRDSSAILDPPYQSLVDGIRERNPAVCYIHVSSTSVLPGGARDIDLKADPAGSANSPDAHVIALDETAPPAPDGARGARRKALEDRVLELNPGALILRAAGIYGPGRCVALQFQSGNFRRAGVGNSYVSRIHVHDLARLFLGMVTQHSADPHGAPRLVHAVDEQPSANADVFAFLEAELQVQVPGDWRSTPPRGRIVRSRFALELLGGRYRFPTYVSGFRDCLRRPQA